MYKTQPTEPKTYLAPQGIISVHPQMSSCKVMHIMSDLLYSGNSVCTSLERLSL